MRYTGSLPSRYSVGIDSEFSSKRVVSATVASCLKSLLAIDWASSLEIRSVGTPVGSRRARRCAWASRISQCGPRPRSVRVMVAISSALSSLIALDIDAGSDWNDCSSRGMLVIIRASVSPRTPWMSRIENRKPPMLHARSWSATTRAR